jgi:hypothetical protein
VREDYSEYGNAWQYFPFEHAHARAYLWGEDGLAGISDRFQNLCFSFALWNGKDEILKERLFGLHNGEGNHGEDVKELYYYLDNLPSHYYMEYLYKYPQASFPYQKLKEENSIRSRQEPEYEILDTGVFSKNRYFDVLVTYAKNSATDIFIKVEIKNRYHRAADITVLPTLCFSNQWKREDLQLKPGIRQHDAKTVTSFHEGLGEYFFYMHQPAEMLFTNNETNFEKINGQPNENIFVKDAFHDALISKKNREQLRAKKEGTKFSAVYKHKFRVTDQRPCISAWVMNGCCILLLPGLKIFLPSAKKKRMNIIHRSFQKGWTRILHRSSARPWPVCSGASNIIVSTWRNGCRKPMALRNPVTTGFMAGTTTGST